MNASRTLSGFIVLVELSDKADLEFLQCHFLLVNRKSQWVRADSFHALIADRIEQRMLNCIVNCQPTVRIEGEGLNKKGLSFGREVAEHFMQVLSRSGRERLELFEKLLVSHKSTVLFGGGADDFED